MASAPDRSEHILEYSAASRVRPLHYIYRSPPHLVSQHMAFQKAVCMQMCFLSGLGLCLERTCKVLTLPVHHRGYWRDAGNVERELRAWMTEHGLSSRLPTNRELRATGHNSLAIAITAYHGGYVAFGKRMRWAVLAQWLVVRRSPAREKSLL